MNLDDPITRVPATDRVERARERGERDRVDAAIDGFIADFGPRSAMYMEACVHCGQCAEACQFYVSTGDPRYTPIHKLAPFRKAYRRGFGPFSFLYRLWPGNRPTLKELEDWQDLLYDSCNMCGRCSLICPMGIDIADLVERARHGMFEAGLVPPDYLGALAQKERKSGSPFGIEAREMRRLLMEIGEKHDVIMHVDEEHAEVVPTVSSIDIRMYPRTMAAMARILNHIGVSWTFRTDGFDADNVSLTAGDRQGQAAITEAIVGAASRCGARLLIMPECGHAYTEMRWEAANTLGRPLPFRVLHLSEYLAECIADGSLRVKRAELAATFHDPCQVSRRGGATQAPRTVMAALGVALHEMPFAGDENWCCGGGGGVALVNRAQPLRDQAFRIKLKQIEETGMDTVLVSCTGCRQTLEHGGERAQWNKTVASLAELVADHLVDDEQREQR